MKNIFCGFLVFFAAAFLCSAEGIAEEARKGNEKADVSYAFGMAVAEDLAGLGLEFNYDAFTRGFRQSSEKEELKFTMDEAVAIMQAAVTAARAEWGEKNLAEGSAFLAENGKKPGVVTTPSGLQYEVVSEGSGGTPAAGDVVRVHYRGSLVDGTVFDTTYESGEPMDIPLDRVIAGWSEGIRMMKEGGKAKLFIPSNLAYGEQGMGGVIGPNALVLFEVEFLSIVKSGEEAVPEEEPPMSPEGAESE